MVTVIGRMRRRVDCDKSVLRLIGWEKGRQPEIVSMHMAERNDHLKRQGQQRQLSAGSNPRSEPNHDLSRCTRRRACTGRLPDDNGRRVHLADEGIILSKPITSLFRLSIRCLAEPGRCRCTLPSICYIVTFQ